ncbi:hypothetical protein K505DRAFT_367511 [Melanomma pulvis-pyrius CBS 109.77]|uniref:Zn(2)-C6 fungal-type domain-containing protein n=1 Tax=Melanomma pulvis-pyrius CBS 109.77 TaxID=1314802 RepID=A0A6A6WSX8_9PLEO|nr:hypothetical protein K505DRAFT_367511 [Melanomma pulvis-pyrius CBS 109.77]
MPPKAQRSRACNQCRERRVKCDETPEVCQQCTRLGLKCSGPVQGSIIINMTERVTKPRQRKKRDARAAVVVREDVVREPPAAPRTEVCKLERTETAPPLQDIPYPTQKPALVQWPPRQWENAIAAIRWQTKLPSVYQPSQAHNLDLAFISHFVELNKGVRPYSPEIPWITHLPTFHTKATKPALRLSIRAAAMAFYANVHGDPAIMVESYRWYTMSLNSQRLALSKMDGKTIPNDDEVLVPIILGLYEVYAGTTPTNVFQHLTAATKIIEMRGPHNCSSGVTFPLFKAMRISDAHKAMIFNQPSLFSTPEWMTIPFIIQPRNAHQYLADILLAIPDCIGLCGMSGSMSSFFSRPLPPRLDLRPVRERTAQLLQKLIEWADKHPHLTSVSPGPLVVTLDMAKEVSGSALTNPDGPPSTVVLPETFVALTAATYEAIQLILTLLLHKISPHPAKSPPAPADPNTPPQSPTDSLISRATTSARSILDIAMFLESTQSVGFDFLRSVFPLVVVGILGPQAEEQKSAVEMMERWGESRGVGGLCGAWINA